MNNMLHARSDHGIILLGKQIFVVAGWHDYRIVRKCETFDLKKAVWTEIPDFDEFGWGVTLVAIKQRFALALGGSNDMGEYTDRYARLDCQKLHKGWQILHLAGFSPLSGRL